MNVPDECPVCGDDVDDLDSLRGHVNAKADHPSWDEVRDRLDGGSDQGDEEAVAANEQGDSPGSDAGEGAEQERDQGEPGDEDANGDQGDAGNDQVEDQGNVPADGDEEGDVPTPEEYKDQHDQGEPTDGDANDDQGEAGSEQGKTPLSAWSNLPVDPKTFLTIIAVAAVAWLLYQAMTTDGAGADVDTNPSGEMMTGSTNDTDAPAPGPEGGGLVE